MEAQPNYGVLGADNLQDRNETEYIITPFIDYKVSQLESGAKAISYGLSGAGYDIRLARLFEVRPTGFAIDPKDPNSMTAVPVRVEYNNETGEKYCILDPHRTYKGVSMEYFRIPTDLVVICLGKSTYARVDVIPHVTPLEQGWNGYLTIEIANLSSYPTRVYLNEGICQLLFLPVSCLSQYRGYYQNQDEQRPYMATETPECKCGENLDGENTLSGDCTL